MGNDNNQDSKNGLISILLLIMLATGTLIDPLTSSRPFDPLNKKLTLMDERKIDARLWQDPIAVTEQFLSNKKEAKKMMIVTTVQLLISLKKLNRKLVTKLLV